MRLKKQKGGIHMKSYVKPSYYLIQLRPEEGIASGGSGCEKDHDGKKDRDKGKGHGGGKNNGGWGWGWGRGNFWHW